MTPRTRSIILRPQAGERNAHRGPTGEWRWHVWACLLCGASRSYPTDRCGSCSRRGIVTRPRHAIVEMVEIEQAQP